MQDGGETWGLRISKNPAAEAPAPPQPQAKKVITEDKVQTVVDWAKKNSKTIDDIAAMYDFESDTVKQAIIDALYDDLP